MHWYYNPVTDLLEPTIREAWANNLPNKNLHDLQSLFTLPSENKLLSDFLTDDLSKDILVELINEIDKIEQIIDYNNDYLELKDQMIGFENAINIREQIIRNNISIIKSKKKDYLGNKIINTKEKIEIKKDTTIKGEFIVNKNQELVIYEGVRLSLEDAYLKIYGGFKAQGNKINLFILKELKIMVPFSLIQNKT